MNLPPLEPTDFALELKISAALALVCSVSVALGVASVFGIVGRAVFFGLATMSGLACLFTMLEAVAFEASHELTNLVTLVLAELRSARDKDAA